MVAAQVLAAVRTVRDDRSWVHEAVGTLLAEDRRSSDTNLLSMPLPEHWNLRLYLKDESTHPTGSLKHRLARSLVLYGLVNGWIGPDTTLVEASSGSTAVSIAYFARLLRLPFIAVIVEGTSAEKVALIRREGGECEFVAHAGQIREKAQEVAQTTGGHFLDQFTFAERATDWRGNNNIAQSIFDQLSAEPFPVPSWIVVGAGTGGTSATIGRYVRYHCLRARVAVADPEGSAFFLSYRDHDQQANGRGSRIEGIGRPQVEPSFVPTVVDRMYRVPDAGSFAAMRWTSRQLRKEVGPSTGTNIFASMFALADMLAHGESGSVVSLICDGGDRYKDTGYDDAWLLDRGLDIDPYLALLDEFLATGKWDPPVECVDTELVEGYSRTEREISRVPLRIPEPSTASRR